MLLQFTRFFVPHCSANTINKCFSLNELGNFQYFINKNRTRFPYEVTDHIWPRLLYWVTSLSYSHLAPPGLVSYLTGQTPWENKCIYILYDRRGKDREWGQARAREKENPRKSSFPVLASCSRYLTLAYKKVVIIIFPWPISTGDCLRVSHFFPQWTSNCSL